MKNARRNNTIKRKLLVLLLLLTSMPLPMLAEVDFSPHFSHITSSNGLSQNSVTAILEDQHHRMWFGTRYGVSIYNGEQFHSIRYNQEANRSILGLFVTSLSQNTYGIWIATKVGLTRYDENAGNFTQYNIPNVSSVVEHRNTLLISTNRSLLTLHPSSGSLDTLFQFSKKEININKTIKQSENTLLVCTNAGLFQLDCQTRESKQIFEHNISTVYCDKQKQTWIGTQNQGVFLLNNEGKPMAHFCEESQSMAHNSVRVIAEDKLGNIWVGTFNGLTIINTEKLSARNFQHDNQDKSSLSNNSIYSLLGDRQGGMWVGTYFGGANYYNEENRLYHHYSQLLSFDIISQILPSKQGGLWVGTEGDGLYLFDEKGEMTKRYSFPQIGHNNIKAIKYWGDKHLLVGTHQGGICQINLDTEEIKKALPGWSVNHISESAEGFILATNKGLQLYRSDTNTSAAIGPSDLHHVNCALEDSKKRRWVGLETKGLYLLQGDSSAVHIDAIMASNISCIFEDRQQNIWIGSLGHGLYRYSPSTKDIKTYNSDNGFPSDFITAIRESPSSGSVVVATSRGIAYIDHDSSFLFSQDNGFPENEANPGALYIDQAHNIYVGTLTGLLVLNEYKLLNARADVNIIFSELRVNNELVTPNDHHHILSRQIYRTKEIKLQNKHKNFALSFASCNYLESDIFEFQHRLEGFDEDWLNSSEYKIAYPNLSPGKYKLRLRAMSNTTRSVVDETAMDIVILPPAYASAYAYMAYLLIIAAIIWVVIKIRRERAVLKHNIRKEKEEREEMERINKYKLNFFTNISHEFRNPLTLISTTLELMIEDKKTRAENRNKLKNAYNNSQRLNLLIKELLDFRKIESNKMKLKVYRYPFVSFINEVCNNYVFYAEKDKVDYRFIMPKAEIYLWFDTNQLEKVVSNLLSNAFKFTSKTEGKVVVEIKEDSQNVSLVVFNTGETFRNEEGEKIFDIYYQIENANMESGNGIGLALSKAIVLLHGGAIEAKSVAHEGTYFTLTIPKGSKHFDSSWVKSVAPNSPIESSSEYLSCSNENPDIDEEKSKSNTILVVDDKADMVELIGRILKADYHLLTASDGMQGLKLALDALPDLIISDVMMPNMSGTEMTSKLKRNPQSAHIPIILLTAKASEDFMLDGLRHGADDYMSKPFTAKMLQVRVKNILTNRLLLKDFYTAEKQSKERLKKAATETPPFEKKAREIVRQHMSDPNFDVPTFATLMGMSRTKFFTEVKQSMNLTPNDLIVSMRLQRAAELLLEDRNMTIAEVAYSVGFTTPRYFSKVFKSYFGMLPSDYCG